MASCRPRAIPFTFCCGAFFYSGPLEYLQRILRKKETTRPQVIMAVVFEAPHALERSHRIFPGLWLGFTSLEEWDPINDALASTPRHLRIAYNLSDPAYFRRIVHDERAEKNRPILAISTSEQKGAKELLRSLGFQKAESWVRGKDYDSYTQRELTLWYALPKEPE